MTTEFKCRTEFWESQNSYGCDNGGCRDSELARVCQQCHMGVMGHNMDTKTHEMLSLMSKAIAQNPKQN